MLLFWAKDGAGHPGREWAGTHSWELQEDLDVGRMLPEGASGGAYRSVCQGTVAHVDCACAGIAIGGDVFPGSTLSDHCLRYENIPQIKLIVVLGELGGQDEYSLVQTASMPLLHDPSCF